MNLKLPRAIIIGSDYFLNSTAESLIAKLEEPETHSYYAEDFELEDFFSTLFTPSLFHEYKLLILKHADNIKKQDEFLAQVARADGAAVLILGSDAKKTATLQKAAKANGFELLMEGKGQAARNSDIKAVFAAQGCAIDEGTAAQIGLLTDGDMIKIQSEAQKAGLYFHGKKPSGAELLSCISGQQSETVFVFLDAFMDRRREKCLQLYTITPGLDGVFYMLASYMAGLYFKLTNEKLYGPANPLFNGKTYFMRTVDKVYRKWKPEEAARMIHSMAQLDLAVKTGKSDAADSMLVLIGYL
ncbi:MAG: hypothetical protein LBV04_10160 [Deferribacteraceae bacterium]|jgi:DNA polymerase III delta subunit|nr:hypothetical protein [Deferribacteraceae bacterium]